MNISPTLKANAKTTKVVEPCVSTLNHPAEFAQSAAVFCAALWFGVVAAIGVNDFGLLERPTTFTANRCQKVTAPRDLFEIVS